MTLDNGICIQRKTTRKTGLFFILSNIRKNVKSYNKKENKKKDITNY